MENMLAGLKPDRLLNKCLLPLLPLLVLPCVCLAYIRWRPIGRAGVLMLVWLISIPLMISLPGRFFAHYYQFWIPFLAIAAAWSLTALEGARTRPPAHLLARFGGATAALLLALQAGNYFLSANSWSVLKYEKSFLWSRDDGVAASALLFPDERLMVAGCETGAYFYSGRRPGIGVLWIPRFLDGPGGAARELRILRDLESRKIEMVILWLGQVEEQSSILACILGNYALLPESENLEFRRYFCLQGGPLEARLRAQGRLP